MSGRDGDADRVAMAFRFATSALNVRAASDHAPRPMSTCPSVSATRTKAIGSFAASSSSPIASLSAASASSRRPRRTIAVGASKVLSARASRPRSRGARRVRRPPPRASPGRSRGPRCVDVGAWRRARTPRRGRHRVELRPTALVSNFSSRSCGATKRSASHVGSPLDGPALLLALAKSPQVARRMPLVRTICSDRRSAGRAPGRRAGPAGEAEPSFIVA